jgi:two-component system phosphate regulon sensor histidine kinase PhoR
MRIAAVTKSLPKLRFLRWPLIPVRQLLAYSLMLVFPTVLALDILVFYGDLHVDFALWVIAGTMVSAVAIAWIFLGDMADMALYTRGVEQGDLEALPALRSSAVREVARAVMQLDGKWRRHVQAFSRSLDTDKEILETLYDPLLLIDAQQHIVGINAAARQLFGEGGTKKALPELGYPPPIVHGVRTVLDSNRPAVFELILPVERYFEIRIIPIAAIAAQDGWDQLVSRPEQIAVVVTLHEITETRRAVAMQERFVANVSHELRTPLAGILGFTETLLGPAKDDEAARLHFLKITHDQAMRMTRLVADLQQLSNVEEKRHVLITGNVDLARLLPAVCEALNLKAVEREISLHLPDFDNREAIVPGDEDQLFRVFQNLIENAIKYGRPGTAVTLRCQWQGAEISIAVQDEGEGIAAEHLPHLGERFYRADKARSRDTGGSGLGLAIVAQILERHNGRLGVTSEIGRGSIFTVFLPLRQHEVT